METLKDDPYSLLLAGMVRQAVDDYRTNYTHPHRPDAGQFLQAAGLMVDGQLDTRFGTVARTRTGRTSHRKQAA